MMVHHQQDNHRTNSGTHQQVFPLQSPTWALCPHPSSVFRSAPMTRVPMLGPGNPQPQLHPSPITWAWCHHQLAGCWSAQTTMEATLRPASHPHQLLTRITWASSHHPLADLTMTAAMRRPGSHRHQPLNHITWALCPLPHGRCPSHFSGLMTMFLGLHGTQSFSLPHRPHRVSLDLFPLPSSGLMMISVARPAPEPPHQSRPHQGTWVSSPLPLRKLCRERQRSRCLRRHRVQAL